MTAAAYADKKRARERPKAYYLLSATDPTPCRSERAAGNPAACYNLYGKPNAPGYQSANRTPPDRGQPLNKSRCISHGFFGKHRPAPFAIWGGDTPAPMGQPCIEPTGTHARGCSWIEKDRERERTQEKEQRYLHLQRPQKKARKSPLFALNNKAPIFYRGK